jgi:hypothetical protein
MAEPIKNLDVVALLRDLPDEGLERGESGTVVLAHEAGDAFEVEFIVDHGRRGNSIVTTVRAVDLLKLKGLKHVKGFVPAQ